MQRLPGFALVTTGSTGNGEVGVKQPADKHCFPSSYAIFFPSLNFHPLLPLPRCHLLLTKQTPTHPTRTSTSVKSSGTFYMVWGSPFYRIPCPSEIWCPLIWEVLPWWLSGKNPTVNAGDEGLIPGLGRSPEEGNSNQLQYSCPGNPMDRGAWRASVRGIAKELDMTQWLNSSNMREASQNPNFGIKLHKMLFIQLKFFKNFFYMDHF